MKLILTLLCFPLLTLAQATYVPDDNFEAYLEANGMGNGIANDDYVTTSNINTINSLDISSTAISDLIGIEGFTSLSTLFCNDNQLTSLDVSQNTSLTNLRCQNNQLVNLDLSNNADLDALNCKSNQLTNLIISSSSALTYLNCNSNQLTSLIVDNQALSQLYCNNNPLLTTLYCNDNQLTSLGVSLNTALTDLRCYNNQLVNLDLSNNADLDALNCESNQLTNLIISSSSALTYLNCKSNQLTSLDLRNGNNQNLLNFNVTSNPNLTCINVDDVNYSTNNWTNIDAQHYFSTNCPVPSSVDEIIHTISLYPNPTNENITITIENFNGNIQTEVYDLIGNILQVSNETTISLSDYARGIYLLKVAYGDRVEEVKVIKD